MFGAILLCLIFASLLLTLLNTQSELTTKSYSGEEFQEMAEFERLTQSIDIELIQDRYEEGVNFISISRWPEALTVCKEGVDFLGEDYSEPGVLEHTNMKLRVAYYQRSQGNIEHASQIYCNALEARMNLYRKKIGALGAGSNKS